MKRVQRPPWLLPSIAIFIVVLCSATSFFLLWYSTSIKWADFVLQDRPDPGAAPPAADSAALAPVTLISLPAFPTLPAILGRDISAAAAATATATATTTDTVSVLPVDDDDGVDDASSSLLPPPYEHAEENSLPTPSLASIPMFTPLAQLGSSRSRSSSSW